MAVEAVRLSPDPIPASPGRRRVPARSLTRRVGNWKCLFGPSRACGPGRPAGTEPSAPVVGSSRLQASRERIVTRQHAVSDGYLASSRDTELLTQHVGVRLRCPRGDAKPLAYLIVRAAGRDQLDNLDLPLREARN